MALFIDRNYGLLRWAPVFALAFAGLWWLWRSTATTSRARWPTSARSSSPAGSAPSLLGAQLLVAAFLAPTMFGFWFPPRHLLAALPLAVPLVALGLRHAPKTGSRSSALTLVGGAWVYADARFFGGALVADRPDAPFGPLTALCPVFKRATTGRSRSPARSPGVALLLVWREARHSRQTAGATRARYSG